MNDAPFLPYRSTVRGLNVYRPMTIQKEALPTLEKAWSDRGLAWFIDKVDEYETTFKEADKNGKEVWNLKPVCEVRLNDAPFLPYRSTKNWIGEEKKHVRKDSFVEFARGDVFYKVGENGYAADVIVGIRSDGGAVLYDLVNIASKKITEASQASENKNRSADRGETSVITSNVSQSDGEVKYSFSGNGYNGYSMSNNAVYG